MSRIGKKPVVIPNGVEVNIDGSTLTVKGPKGTLSVVMHPHVRATIEQDPKAVTVAVEDGEQVDDRALWGLTRQLIANAVEGVQKPYSKALEFVGVGFKVALEGRTVMMDVGFSHRVPFELPQGIDGKVDKQVLTIEGIDKQLVGETAARIRRVKPPEPYKGKGIKYVDEVIRRKAGKAASK